jgi:hypothetical protein
MQFSLPSRSWLDVHVPRRIDVAIALVVLLALTAPAIFTKQGFVDDWLDHLWLTWMQSREIEATGHPSLFLNAEPLGVFYPNFAFYGGTLYSIGGYLMALTGAPVAVFVAMIVVAFAAAYGGTLWLARQARVGGLAAHLPAVILVSSAYYLTIAYGRGAWPELMATSMIPLVLAAGLSIVCRGPSPTKILALVIATTVWSGSHNITLLWGTIFLGAIFLCLLLGWLATPSERQARNLVMVLGLMGIGVMINGWFLWPDIAYAGNTVAAGNRALASSISSIFSPLSIVFSPLRERASHSTYLKAHFTELPVLVIGWLVLAAAVLWRDGWSVRRRRLLAALGLWLAILLVLLVDEGAWAKLPATLSVIQFTFRLETYIVMTIAGLTIMLLRAMRGRRHIVLGAALGAAVAFGLALGVWQVWNSNAYYFPTSPHYLANRSSVLRYPHHTPPTWYDPGQFHDAGDQVVPTEGSIRLNPALIKGESTTQTLTIPPGEGPLASNIAASVNLVSVRGLAVAGRTAAGFLALDRPADGAHTVTVTVTRAHTTPLQLGPVVSVLGVLGLIVVLLVSIVSPRRRSSVLMSGRRERVGSAV